MPCVPEVERTRWMAVADGDGERSCAGAAPLLAATVASGGKAASVTTRMRSRRAMADAPGRARVYACSSRGGLTTVGESVKLRLLVFHYRQRGESWPRARSTW